MAARKRVFVSDIHMSPGLSFGGSTGSYDWFDKDEAGKFGRFLRYLIEDDSMHEVIFLGDVMDAWVYPIEIQPPEYDKTAGASHIVGIMTNLRTLAQRKKGNVTYVMGNHDMTLMETRFDDFRRNVFAGINFQYAYETADGVHAEHGHQYAMYNAIDPKHEVPVGHYLSRLAATIAGRKRGLYTSSDIEFRFASAGDLGRDAGGLISDPLVNAPLSFLAGELGDVDDDTPIITVNGGAITLGEVRKQYARLGIDWTETHGLLDGIRSVWREAVGLDGVAYQIAAGKNKKLIIFGHTHKRENYPMRRPNPVVSPGPDDAPFAVYANCGAWCQGIEPTYVVDEYDEDSDTHTVTLKYWEGTAPDVISRI